MGDLPSLIARLKAAKGPDRELDAEIAVATFVTIKTEDDLVYAHKRSPGDATHPGHYFIKSRSGAQAHSAPSYTASVDAALTLVPAGWWLTLDEYIVTDDPKWNSMKWRVWLKRMIGDVFGDGCVALQEVMGNSGTPRPRPLHRRARSQSRDGCTYQPRSQP